MPAEPDVKGAGSSQANHAKCSLVLWGRHSATAIDTGTVNVGRPRVTHCREHRHRMSTEMGHVRERCPQVWTFKDTALSERRGKRKSGLHSLTGSGAGNLGKESKTEALL